MIERSLPMLRVLPAEPVRTSGCACCRCDGVPALAVVVVPLATDGPLLPPLVGVPTDRLPPVEPTRLLLALSLVLVSAS